MLSWEINLLVRTSRRQLTLIESETRQLERLQQRSCIRVLVSQFDGVVRFKMELRKMWTEAVHVGFARGDFRVVSRSIVFDQWSSVRVSAVLSGCQVSVFSGRIVRVT